MLWTASGAGGTAMLASNVSQDNSQSRGPFRRASVVDFVWSQQSCHSEKAWLLPRHAFRRYCGSAVASRSKLKITRDCCCQNQQRARPTSYQCWPRTVDVKADALFKRFSCEIRVANVECPRCARPFCPQNLLIPDFSGLRTGFPA